MFRVDAGLAPRYCDGMSRRSFVQLGMAGMGAVGLPQFARAKELTAGKTGQKKNTSVILIWLDGGPGHMDMYDMKPEAPAIYRGLWTPIRSNVPGFDMTELYPKQAQVADKFSMVRSLHHDTGDHFAGGHRMLTTKNMGVSGANSGQKFPGIGAIVAREVGSRKQGMPAYLSVPHASSIGLVPGYFGGHMLGVQYDPFMTHADPNAPNFTIPNLNLAPGLSIDRLGDRRTLNAQLDRIPRTVDRKGTFDSLDRFDQDAFEFVSGPAARKAFFIDHEDPRLRDQYGRNSWGQSTLLARRLVEAGATFVTVQYSGWDHHWDLKGGYERVLPMVDSAVASLFQDLDQRGLLETTLVVLCGEFSRTPRMNDGGNGGAPMSQGTPGRDHWGNSMFCLMGGGGVKGGQIIGSTDRLGTAPATRPVTPANIHATIYKVLGIDPTLHIIDHAGRPTPVLEDPTAIDELLA